MTAESSWRSESDAVPLSPNSTFQSRSAVDQSLATRDNQESHLLEMSIKRIDGSQVIKRILLAENADGLLRGFQRMNNDISALVRNQSSAIAKTNVLKEQTDLYTELLEQFKHRTPSELSAIKNCSEVENTRATAQNFLYRPASGQSVVLAGSKPFGSALEPTDNGDTLTDLSLPTLQSSSGCCSSADSENLLPPDSEGPSKPLASSSPFSKASKVPTHHDATTYTPKTTSSCSIEKMVKCQAIQVSPDVVDCSVLVDVQNGKETKTKSKRRMLKNVSVQVSLEKEKSPSHSFVLDEGFSEPTDPLPSTDRKDVLTLVENGPSCPKGSSRAQHSSRKAHHLESKKVFVAGTSTSSSHSVYIAAQQLLHAVKLGDPFLLPVLGKCKSPPAIGDFLIAYVKRCENELERIREHIRLDIGLYDQIEKEIENHSCGRTRRNLKSRQVEIVHRVGRNDLQVRRMETKIKAARENLQRLSNKARSYKLTNKYAHGWLMPTVASQDKVVTSRIGSSVDTNNGSKENSLAALRQMRAIKQFIDRNAYATASS